MSCTITLVSLAESGAAGCCSAAATGDRTRGGNLTEPCARDCAPVLPLLRLVMCPPPVLVLGKGPALRSMAALRRAEGWNLSGL